MPLRLLDSLRTLAISGIRLLIRSSSTFSATRAGLTWNQDLGDHQALAPSRVLLHRHRARIRMEPHPVSKYSLILPSP